MSNFSENSSYNVPGIFGSSSSNQEDQKKEITFIFPDEHETQKVVMYKDKAKANAYNLNGGFLFCMDDVNSRIKEVAVFETILKGFLGTYDAGRHAFVLLLVDNYYVTFEKHAQGLTIQISKDFASVVLKHMNKNRETPINLVVQDSGVKTIQQLANFIAEKNFAFEEYNALGGIHCKKFAGDVFDKVAKNQIYNWKSEETMDRGATAATVATVGAGLIFGPIPAALTFVGGGIITGMSAAAADIGADSRKKK